MHLVDQSLITGLLLCTRLTAKLGGTVLVKCLSEKRLARNTAQRDHMFALKLYQVFTVKQNVLGGTTVGLHKSTIANFCSLYICQKLRKLLNSTQRYFSNKNNGVFLGHSVLAAFILTELLFRTIPSYTGRVPAENLC